MSYNLTNMPTRTYKRKPISEEARINMSNAQKGKKHSEETKKKMRLAHLGNKYNLGKKHSEEWKRKIGEKNRGRKYTEDTKKKMSLGNKNKPRLNARGEKSAHWKGGVTSENKKLRMSIEYRLWRESIFARDNWICQKCGIKGIYLHPHHIRNFAEIKELRFAIDNGITFCKNCHLDFHNKYGRKNNTKEQLTEFIKIKYE